MSSRGLLVLREIGKTISEQTFQAELISSKDSQCK
jgi:hypothetical protein